MAAATLPFRAPVFDQCLGSIAGLSPQGARLLDVGCWTGDFVEAARAAGWAASGIELSTRAAHFATSARGLDVRCCTLAAAPWPAGSFDVVTMLDVLEHVTDPVSELQRARRLLKPGGLIVVRVPNTAFHLAKSRFYRWLGVHEAGSQSDYHLNHFTPRTLTHALHRAGFEVQALQAGAPESIARAAWANPWAKRAYLALARLVNRFTGAHIENITVAYARRRG